MRRAPIAGIFVVFASACASFRTTEHDPKGGAVPLTIVAVLDHQVTGVAVAPDERVFVCFPRWTEDSPVSVAEVRSSGVVPFPDDRWNAWRNAKKDELAPADHWVCVQSVVIGPSGSLWVLDPAAPALGAVVPGGPKLVEIELDPQRIARRIAFGPDTAPQGSYLNDVRFAPDGRHAFLTDSGASGALIVVDLQSGRSRRVLDGHPSTQCEKAVTIRSDGRELRRADGRTLEAAADGIALSADGQFLYWQALKGRTLYRIATAALVDDSIAADQLAARVERVGENGVADGLWIDARGRMYVTAPEENAIKVRVGNDLEVLVRDDALRWPDSLAIGGEGALYVTASRIQDMSWFEPRSGPRLETRLYRIEPRDLADGGRGALASTSSVRKR